MDLVSACGTTTIDGLGLPVALGLRDDHTGVIAASRTETGKVYSHRFNLTLPARPLNVTVVVNPVFAQLEP